MPTLYKHRPFSAGHSGIGVIELDSFETSLGASAGKLSN